MHFSVDEEIDRNLLVNHQIRNHDTRSNNEISILRVNKSANKTLCHTHWYDNMKFFRGCIQDQRIFFYVQEQCTVILSVKILV